jgi:hypothetical protein
MSSLLLILCGRKRVTPHFMCGKTLRCPRVAASIGAQPPLRDDAIAAMAAGAEALLTEGAALTLDEAVAVASDRAAVGAATADACRPK